MPTRILTVIAMASAAALICAAYLPADEPAPLAEAIGSGDAAMHSACLGYTARLEFKVVHPEGTPTFFTHSCGGRFDISEDISEPNHEHTMKFEGTLTQGDDDGRLLLQFDVQGHHADLNEGFEAVHSASGSALLTPGETLTLTLLGDAPLQVTVTRED